MRALDPIVRGRVVTVLIGAGGAVLALLIGQLTVLEPVTAVASVAVLGVLTVGYWAPRVTLLAALASYSFSLEQRTSYGRPEASKAAVILLALPLVLARGLHPHRLLPIAGYLAVLVFTYLGATKLPGLGPTQMASSLISLSMGWVIFAIRFRREDVQPILITLALLPSISVGLGVLVFLPLGYGAGVPGLDPGSTRLEGAVIAPYLAMLGCVGAVSAAVWLRSDGGRWPLALLAANVTFTVLTVTRGGIIALVIMLLPVGWQLLRRPDTRRVELHALTLGAAVAAVIAITFVAIPLVQQRNAPVAGSIDQRDATFNSSGRFDAWNAFYEISQVNPLFGRGLGSGPITKIDVQGFRAQHNEYLRMKLEGGWVGGGLLLLTILVALGGALRRAPPASRSLAAALLAGFLVFSFTDNTLSAPTFAVPFLTLFGVLCRPSDAPSGR